MRRREPLEDEPEDCGAEMSKRSLRGGTNTVEREPLLVTLLLLSMDSIVLIDPVGERVIDAEEESGRVTGRWTASL